jgi:hypothetical protein
MLRDPAGRRRVAIHVAKAAEPEVRPCVSWYFNDGAPRGQGLSCTPVDGGSCAF